MTHSIESEFDQIKQKVLMNPLPRVFQEIKQTKQEIKQLNDRLDLLKEEIDEHYKQGNIKEKHSEEGVTVTRKKCPQRYEFSEMVEQLKVQLNKRKEMEIEDDIAIAKPTNYTWEIRLAKSET